MLSDSESSDSDNGIRFKTTSTRAKEESYAAQSSSHTSNGRYDSWKSSRDERSSTDLNKDHRRSGYSDRRSGGISNRRSESRDRKRSNRSTSRDRQSSRVVDRRRSRSRERQRDSDNKKPKEQTTVPIPPPTPQPHQQRDHVEKVTNVTTRIPKEPSRSRSREKSSNTVSHSDDRSIDKHKVKKSKHKKHKRGKRDENSKERTKSLERDEIVPITTVGISSADPNSRSNNDVRKPSSEAINKSLHSTTKNTTKAMDEDCLRKSNSRRPSLTPTNDDLSNSPICGPKLPPHLRSRSVEKKEKSSSSSASSHPHRHRSKDPVQLGPSLPPPKSATHHRRKDEDTTSSTSDRNAHAPSKNSTIVGPAAPTAKFLLEHEQDTAMSDISETEDDYLIGPLPDGATHKSEAHLELEKRALELKLAKFSERDSMEDLTVRDEWMLELPEVKVVTNLGLTARQFRTKERPDMSDRSSWTDTPKERERKIHHGKGPPTAEEVRSSKQKEAKASFIAKRDAEQEDAARKHRKHHRRDESLVDMHQKKMKKKKEVSNVFQQKKIKCK